MNVLITGAAGGIGSNLVRLFASKGDVDVIAVSRSGAALENLKAETERQYGRSIDTLVSDFTEPDFQTHIADHIESKYGYLTYLINNAGHLVNNSFESTTDEELDEQLRINFRAPFVLIRTLMPLLRKSPGHAHVVNIGSMGGFQGSDKYPGLSAYSSSKAALASLTECLSREYSAETISFNCLALGSANTEMLRLAFPDYTSSMEANRMAEFIVHFTTTGFEFFDGQVLPVARSET